MTHSFNAIFENGIIKPLEPLMLPNHTLVKVELTAPRDTLSTETHSMSDLEFDQQLDALVADGPTLPSDFSRDDIYNAHD